MANNDDERCEANFYIGEWHLISGVESKAIDFLRYAAENCPSQFIEYKGAVAEINRLGQ
jgi:rhomboid protease GluP